MGFTSAEGAAGFAVLLVPADPLAADGFHRVRYGNIGVTSNGIFSLADIKRTG